MNTAVACQMGRKKTPIHSQNAAKDKYKYPTSFSLQIKEKNVSFNPSFKSKHENPYALVQELSNYPDK